MLVENETERDQVQNASDWEPILFAQHGKQSQDNDTGGGVGRQAFMKLTFRLLFDCAGSSLVHYRI